MDTLLSRFSLARIISLLTVALVAVTAIVLVGLVTFEVRADASHTAMKFQDSAMRIDASILQGQFGDALVDWKADGNVGKITLDQLPDASASDLIDQMSRVSGQATTLFAYDAASDDYVRTATSIKKSDGSRATGTKLGHDSRAWPVIASGKAYIGKAKILGQNYYTIYQPILNTHGKVIGILFSGQKGKDISGEASAALVKVSIMAAVLVVLFGGAALLVSQRLMAPLQQLENSVAAIAAGRYEIDVPFTLWRNEIGSMARALELFRTQGRERQHLAAIRDQDDENKALRQKRLDHLVAAFQADMAQALESVAASSTDILSTAEALSLASTATADNAEDAGHAAFEASGNVQTVASAAEELTASIREINDQVARANAVVADASRVTADTNDKVNSLSEAATRIGEVVNLIQAIAAQTNLLALNATIEAARAGEAGKGFAVVASEVKDLAAQTARATAEISAQVNAIQASTGATVEAIANITGTMTDVSIFTSAIAAAVEQQGAATHEISHNVTRAADGTKVVSDNIVRVRDETAHTALAAEKLAQASRDIAGKNAHVKTLIARFLSEADAA